MHAQADLGARRGSDCTPEPTSGGLTVVIPAYNEAGNLDSLVRNLIDELGSVADFEILIVDDGSLDATGQIADRLAVSLPRVRAFHHPVNVGYGGALKTGFRAAEKEWIAAIPADHQFDVRDLKQLLRAGAAVDIVTSYRLGRKDNWRRRLISRLYNEYVSRRFGLHYRDLNWVKMFRRQVVRDIEIETCGFSVDLEILLKARYFGWRVAEVPVDHYPRACGTSTTTNIRSFYRTARELLRINAMNARLQAGAGNRRECPGPP